MKKKTLFFCLISLLIFLHSFNSSKNFPTVVFAQSPTSHTPGCAPHCQHLGCGGGKCGRYSCPNPWNQCADTCSSNAQCTVLTNTPAPSNCTKYGCVGPCYTINGVQYCCSQLNQSQCSTYSSYGCSWQCIVTPPPPTNRPKPTKTPTPKPTTPPAASPTPTVTLAPSPTVNPSCVCKTDESCDASCSFDYYSDVTYTKPPKCSRESSIPGPTPDATGKTGYCQRNLRTKGDVDGDGVITSTLDYFYFVSVVNGGGIPSFVNADINGDGLVSPNDRDILIRSLHGQ